MGHGTKVGEAASDVVTRKNLIIRLQAPRFFVQTDEVVLSANVHNYLKQGKSVQVRLELEGNTLEPLDELVRTINIAANDEARVDWRVRVKAEGEAVVRMAALTDEESDAMEMRFPAYVHGMDKMVPTPAGSDRIRRLFNLRFSSRPNAVRNRHALRSASRPHWREPWSMLCPT